MSMEEDMGQEGERKGGWVGEEGKMLGAICLEIVAMTCGSCKGVTTLASSAPAVFPPLTMSCSFSIGSNVIGIETTERRQTTAHDDPINLSAHTFLTLQHLTPSKQ